MVDPNTRQGKRTPVTLKIKFKSETLEQFIERYAVDVSQGGIFIRTKDPLAVGTQMRFEFQLRDASPLIGGEGTVVWTRENDPGRPAIAPGMGVRFDRLAEGSQTVLERILADKAKQAPQRPPSKPPMFADTPTRVASPLVQEALLANDGPRRADSGFSEQQTPLPKPVPFHSDADEFPEEAFEEATKVRSLDELIAQTAGARPAGPSRAPVPAVLAGERFPAGKRVPVGDLAETQPELFTDRPDRPRDEITTKAARVDATFAEPSPETLDLDAEVPFAPSSTSPGFASGRVHDDAARRASGLDDGELAPGLPSPPDTSDRNRGERPTKSPRLLDTTPSPRTESDPMEKLMKTKLGMEPVHVSTKPVIAAPPSFRESPTVPSGIRAVPAEPTNVVRRMPSKKSSTAPILILVLVLVAAGSAGVWFFGFRNRAIDDNATKNHGSGSGSDRLAGAGSDAAGSGSSGTSDGSAKVAGSGSGTPAVWVELEVTSSAAKSLVEVLGTSETGPAPFKTKLEKAKPYKIRVSAPGFIAVEQEVKGGEDKWVAKLDPKPRTITVKSEPIGALISVDNAPIGHSTPFDIELSKVQTAKKSVRIRVYKAGYRPIERVVDSGAYKEEPTKMVVTLDFGTLAVQPQIVRPPPVGSGSGSDSSGSGSDGSAAGSGSGSSTSSGSGSNEPTPDFVRPNP